MQTPRGFLIGAAAIAAIAAFASVGHPRSETDVHMASPATSLVAQTPTINASSDNPDIEVLSEHVEAGDAMPSTTMELAGPTGDGDAPQAPTTTIAPPTSEQLTIDAPSSDDERSRPSVATTEHSTEAPAAPTTVPAPPPTSSPTTTVAATVPTTSVPQPAVPPITIPSTTPAVTAPTTPMVTAPASPIVMPPQIVVSPPVAPQVVAPAMNGIAIGMVDIDPRKTTPAG